MYRRWNSSLANRHGPSCRPVERDQISMTNTVPVAGNGAGGMHAAAVAAALELAAYLALAPKLTETAHALT